MSPRAPPTLKSTLKSTQRAASSYLRIADVNVALTSEVETLTESLIRLSTPSIETLILESTPSIRDSIIIIKDEWLLEIGYMNYDFGLGISEWSLFIVPAKVLAVALLGALVSTNYLLLRQSSSCQKISSIEARSAGTATGVGATLMAIASITLSWVVCCSTPTWVVGLAMLGLGATTALWLEPLGTWLNVAGLIILLGVCIHLARPDVVGTESIGEMS